MPRNPRNNNPPPSDTGNIHDDVVGGGGQGGQADNDILSTLGPDLPTLDEFAARAGITGDRRPFIGVPDTHRVMREELAPVTDPLEVRFGRGGTTRQVPTAPLYREGDEWLPAGLPPQDIRRLQERLVQAGLLDAEGFTPGWFDTASRKAYRQALAEANGAAVDVATVLASRIAAVEEAGGLGRGEPVVPGFVKEPYLAPDYDALSQLVRRTMKNELGRDPQDWELTVLAQQIEEDYKANYDQRMGIAEATHDAQVRAAQTGEDVKVGGGGEEVDPVASFMERFRERYQPEMRAEQAEEDVMESRGLLLRSILGIDEQIG